MSLPTAAAEGLEQQLAAAGEGLAKLPKGKQRQVSATDPDSRFLRTRQGWVLGYTGEVAVSDDHFIVAARVTQNASDNASLLPLLDEVERRASGRRNPAFRLFHRRGCSGAGGGGSTCTCRTTTCGMR